MLKAILLKQQEQILQKHLGLKRILVPVQTSGEGSLSEKHTSKRTPLTFGN